MTRKQQAGGKDEPGATASGLASKDESLESQLKNVDINKVHKYIITQISQKLSKYTICFCLLMSDGHYMIKTIFF